jgi:23S rRNA pseudouridine955/2504/2580 synthase
MNDGEAHGRVQIWTIGDEAEDQRIDNYLLKQLKGVPRSRIYRMLRRGEVRLNGGRVKATCRLHSGDKVRIPPLRMAAAAPQQRLTPEQGQRLAALTIYEDERLLVINKPSGLAVHGGSGISQGVIERLRLLRPQQRELELVHRLDRETSGLLMIAKRRSALRRLHELQRQGAIKKSYLALLHGDWPRNRMEVKVPLKTNQVLGGERIVRPHPQGKQAQTAFRIKEQFGEAMLVEAVLGTGRTHQIRVHAQYLGTPILGDSKYADEPTRQLARQLGLKRLFLHAEKLSFPWGENGELLQLQAPLEQPLVAILAQLRER